MANEEKKPEFLEVSVKGLVAIYEERKGRDKHFTSAPIVGYFKNENGDLVAAVVGDGACVVPANKIRGFVGVRWEKEETVVSETRRESLFEGIFGSKF